MKVSLGILVFSILSVFIFGSRAKSKVSVKPTLLNQTFSTVVNVGILLIGVFETVRSFRLTNVQLLRLLMPVEMSVKLVNVDKLRTKLVRASWLLRVNVVRLRFSKISLRLYQFGAIGDWADCYSRI